MGSSWWLIGLAVMAGALGSVHVPINGALGARIQSTVVATFTFYGIAFATIAGIALTNFDREAFRNLARIPPWYFVLPGLISVTVVGANTYLIPRLGAVNLFVITVGSQLLGRALISHFGWLESPVDPVSWPKVLGAAMVVSGSFLVVRS